MSTEENQKQCEHDWIANSGRGGVPEFRINRQVSSKPVMHAKCALCGDRTWFTRDDGEEEKP